MGLLLFYVFNYLGHGLFAWLPSTFQYAHICMVTDTNGFHSLLSSMAVHDACLLDFLRQRVLGHVFSIGKHGTVNIKRVGNRS